MNNVQTPWPPDEPVVPAVVVARLDQLGYDAESYRLDDYTARHALIVTANAVIVLDLGDGHEFARYTDIRGGRDAFAVLARRDAEEDGRG